MLSLSILHMEGAPSQLADEALTEVLLSFGSPARIKCTSPVNTTNMIYMVGSMVVYVISCPTSNCGLGYIVLYFNSQVFSSMY